MNPVGNGTCGAPAPGLREGGGVADSGTCGGMGEAAGGGVATAPAGTGTCVGRGGGGRTLLGACTAAAAARASREAGVGNGGSGGLWAMLLPAVNRPAIKNVRRRRRSLRFMLAGVAFINGCRGTCQNRGSSTSLSFEIRIFVMFRIDLISGVQAATSAW